MPFTLSHVAAVLPLVRGRQSRLSATGLIIGSIAPDFEKFIRLGLHNRYSHTWPSIFYFSCPVALGLAFLFHGVVRDPLIAHLPAPLYRRLARFQDFDWSRHFRRHYGVVLISILLGATTHLLWDSFTHRQGPLVQQLAWLRLPVPTLGSAPVFGLLSLLSSIGGVGLVSWFVLRLPPAGSTAGAASPAARGRYWRLGSLTALVLLAVRLLLTGAALRFEDAIVTALSAAMLGVVVAAACFRNPPPPARRLT